ncbi:cupin domain-containing protein [Asaia krungthepensis]|uniref:XRE family transcriptional regulator n=1 Tax=Asaia krungthepensis NRIC 0535 TaxID=1307925 RepID=A0ABQ0PVD5_9PROT|nr:cupin domain-containing protein [Asaia krungthepensis]GBQ82563.1 XRE family transcriptional regulator [Asaia krungthepensis NRIC 0535]
MNEPVAVTSNIDRTLGNTIRERRKQIGYLLKDVASRVGISLSHLSQIERGASSPSIRDLMKISDVLELDMSNFFGSIKGQSHDNPAFYTRIEDHGLLSFGEGITKVMLNSQSPDLLRTYLMIIEPNGHSGAKILTHSGFESGLVLQGCLHLQVGGQDCILREGDSFSFPSETPHRYSNGSSQVTRVVWANVDTP